MRLGPTKTLTSTMALPSQALTSQTTTPICTSSPAMESSQSWRQMSPHSLSLHARSYSSVVRHDWISPQCVEPTPCSSRGPYAKASQVDTYAGRCLTLPAMPRCGSMKACVSRVSTYRIAPSSTMTSSSRALIRWATTPHSLRIPSRRSRTSAAPTSMLKALLMHSIATSSARRVSLR